MVLDWRLLLAGNSRGVVGGRGDGGRDGDC